MQARERIWRIIKIIFFAWYIPNIAWNLYSLAHADPSQLLNMPEVLKALALPWPLSNPQTPIWIDMLFIIAIIVVFLWVSKRLPKLIVLLNSMGGTKLLRRREGKASLPIVLHSSKRNATVSQHSRSKGPGNVKIFLSLIFSFILALLIVSIIIGLMAYFTATMLINVVFPSFVPTLLYWACGILCVAFAAGFAFFSLPEDENSGTNVSTKRQQWEDRILIFGAGVFFLLVSGEGILWIAAIIAQWNITVAQWVAVISLLLVPIPFALMVYRGMRDGLS